MILSNYFHLASVSTNSILTILKVIQVSKTAGIGNLPGRFLKVEGKFLYRPISNICNLSITSETFPDSCKKATRTSTL